MNMAMPQAFDVHTARQMWTQVQAEEMRRDFRRFVAECWHVVEPGKEFKGGWHIDAICDHLTYVSLGDIDDLVIIERGGAARGHHHVGAGFGKGCRHCAAEAAARAGHERDLAVESEIVEDQFAFPPVLRIRVR